jgi:hypothetical protein
MNGLRLPPTPAAVAAYFRARRSAIAEFTPEALQHNERLWLELCGLPEPSEPTVPAAAEAEPHLAATMPPRATGSPAGELPPGPCGFQQNAQNAQKPFKRLVERAPTIAERSRGAADAGHRSAGWPTLRRSRASTSALRPRNERTLRLAYW